VEEFGKPGEEIFGSQVFGENERLILKELKRDRAQNGVSQRNTSES
jgi:hypothetical protein